MAAKEGSEANYWFHNEKVDVWGIIKNWLIKQGLVANLWNPSPEALENLLASLEKQAVLGAAMHQRIKDNREARRAARRAERQSAK